jgi:arylsulfatase A-like enzyme
MGHTDRLTLRVGALCACLAAAGCFLEPPQPNVLLVVIDTLRADRVSSYGYRRPTTPNIDAIAAAGIRFERANSTSSWTLPAHASMFTGRFPIEHGATQEHTVVDEALPTLAERFAEAGYATVGISGNGVVNRGSGLARGFGEFVEGWRESAPTGAAHDRHPNIVALRRSLQRIGKERPFFAFVNFIEVHGPYAPPAPYRGRFLSEPGHSPLVQSATRRKAPAYYLDPSSISDDEFRVLNDLYDGEVAYADALVGALMAELETAGVRDDTVVVITSDHGENIGDHGHFRHVFSLYHTTVRVPLIVSFPDGARAGEVRSEAVSLIDLYPTLLGLAGLDPADAAPRARDILADSALPAAPVFAEYYFPLQVLQMFDNSSETGPRETLDTHLRRLRSVEHEGWRLIWSSNGAHELYRTDRDAAEHIDRSGDPSAATSQQQLLQTLDEFVAAAGGSPPLPDGATRLVDDAGAFGDLDAETRRHLQELGYLPESPE